MGVPAELSSGLEGIAAEVSSLLEGKGPCRCKTIFLAVCQTMAYGFWTLSLSLV